MAFPETITLTVNTVAKILNRINQDTYGSEYQLLGATESINLKIRHSADSVDKDGLVMKRHNVFVEHVVYPTPVAAMKKFTYTVTLRHDQYSDPILAVDLGKASNVWLATATNIADVGVGKN